MGEVSIPLPSHKIVGLKVKKKIRWKIKMDHEFWLSRVLKTDGTFRINMGGDGSNPQEIAGLIV